MKQLKIIAVCFFLLSLVLLPLDVTAQSSKAQEIDDYITPFARCQPVFRRCFGFGKRQSDL